MATKSSSFGRYLAGVYAAMYVGYMGYVSTRKSFSNVMPFVVEEKDVSKSDLGFIVSSQMVAYGISKFSSGIFVDRMSPRIMIAVGLFCCGILNLVFPLFESTTVYAILWFINGLTQGFGWPACAKIMKQWVTPAQFGTYWSILSTSMNVAGVLGPPLSIFIASSYGWEYCLQIQGSAAIVISVVCFLVIRNSPSDVGLEKISTDTGGKVKTDKVEVTGEDTVWDIVTSPFIWVIFVVDCVAFGVASGCIDWSQLYLIQEIGLSPELSSTFVSALQLGATIGSIAAGYITDRQIAKYGIQARGSARYPALMVFMFLLTLALHLLVFWTDKESPRLWILLIGFVIGGGTFGPVALLGVVAIEHSPAHLSGTAHAIAALGPNVGAVLAGLPLTAIANSYNWAGAFIAMEICSAIAIVIIGLTWNIPSKIGRKDIKTE